MRTLIILPTYNEAENIRPLIGGILETAPGADVLVVDDASPDGTSELVAALGAGEPRVHLLKRAGKKGRGLAGIDGFRHGLTAGYDVLVEMDADFSHPPVFLPALIEGTKRADLVVGSRRVRGAATEERGRMRAAVSLLASRLIRLILRTGVQDGSSGYRAFRRSTLEKVDWDRMISSGPSIVEELLYECTRRGAGVREIPIRFANRRAGRSKLTPAKLIGVLAALIRIRFK